MKKNPKRPGEMMSMGFGFVEFSDKTNAMTAMKKLQGKSRFPFCPHPHNAERDRHRKYVHFHSVTHARTHAHTHMYNTYSYTISQMIKLTDKR